MRQALQSAGLAEAHNIALRSKLSSFSYFTSEGKPYLQFQVVCLSNSDLAWQWIGVIVTDGRLEAFGRQRQVSRNNSGPAGV
jgi:hypothetical protein